MRSAAPNRRSLCRSRSHSNRRACIIFLYDPSQSASVSRDLLRLLLNCSSSPNNKDLCPLLVVEMKRSTWREKATDNKDKRELNAEEEVEEEEDTVRDDTSPSSKAASSLHLHEIDNPWRCISYAKTATSDGLAWLAQEMNKPTCFQPRRSSLLSSCLLFAD